MMQFDAAGNPSTVVRNGDGTVTISARGKTVVLRRSYQMIEQRDGEIFLDGVKVELDKEPEGDDGETTEPKRQKRTLNVTIEIAGNVGSVQGGQISVTGNVTGDVHASSAPVKVGGVVGSVNTASGDVTVQGRAHDINTASGDVTVNGPVTGSICTASGNISRR